VPVPVPVNGVDTPALLATLESVRAQPELARFCFRATNTWLQGTHSRTRIETFDGAGGARRHTRGFTYDADQPQVLAGRDQGPTPLEFVLHALAGCFAAAIGSLAAAQGVTLYEVESTIEGDVDLRGALGISTQGRSGYRELRIRLKVRGDAPPEKLRAIVEQSRCRSAVYDILTAGVPVSLSVDAR
jgi:uncharacterized OsmC-like protein